MAHNQPTAAAEQYSANCGTGAAEKKKKENIYPTIATHKWLYTVLVQTLRYLNRNQLFPLSRSNWILLEDLHLYYKPV